MSPTPLPRILLVDDERTLVRSLSYALRRLGFAATGAGDAATARRLVAADSFDLALVDLRLPDASGIGLTGEIAAARPGLPVVVISAYGDTRSAVEAMKAGARDFLTKPFDLDELVALLHRLLDGDRPAAEEGDDGIVGDSPAMRRLREQLHLVARSSARTVLLLGESGTGKALAARALHRRSRRAGGPFVELNCAALPENLLEAELFGVERGAYTGADARRPGLAALADGGTLFLDEIGELPPALQAKLLGFLDSHRFRPVGGTRETTSDLRVVAATNRDLRAAVEAGDFRADLWYRLGVLPVELPPLRERGDDVLLLARHFARLFAGREGVAPVSFTEESQALLRRYPWPGNVRELANLVERFTILASGARIGPERLPPEFHDAGGRTERALAARLLAAERELVLEALAASGGRRTEAASRLGISRHALKRRLQRLGLAGT